MTKFASHEVQTQSPKEPVQAAVSRKREVLENSSSALDVGYKKPRIDGKLYPTDNMQIEGDSSQSGKLHEHIHSSEKMKGTHTDIKIEEFNYTSWLDASISARIDTAYVVNSILPYTEVHRIPEVARTITEGLPSKYKHRVTFVFGVNAHESKRMEMQRVVELENNKIDAQEGKIDTGTFGLVPTALVTSTFKKEKFPYGTMRNAVLHSAATHNFLKGFLAEGFYPYVSFQDFDTGSRLTPEKKHIYQYLDEKMQFNQEETRTSQDQAGSLLKGTAHTDQPGRLNDAEAQSEVMPPFRPLLMVGGYHVPADLSQKMKKVCLKQKESLKTAIDDAEKDPKKIQKTTKLYNIYKSLSEDDALFDSKIESFKEKITRDHKIRETLVTLSPLLPYGPEPNLYVCGLLVLASGKLNLDTKKIDVQFGSDGAEYGGLSRSVMKAFAWELERHYKERLRNAPTAIHVKKSTQGQILEKLLPQDREEIRAQFVSDAQNNRTPLRGQSFMAHFYSAAEETGTIETDLSRLFRMYVETGRLPQDHANPNQFTERLFNSKSGKEGLKYEEYRQNHEQDPYKQVETLRVRKVQSTGDIENAIQLSKKNLKILGAINELNPTVSYTYETGPLKGLTVGILPEHRVVISQSAALSRPENVDLRYSRFYENTYSHSACIDELVRNTWAQIIHDRGDKH